MDLPVFDADAASQLIDCAPCAMFSAIGMPVPVCITHQIIPGNRPIHPYRYVLPSFPLIVASDGTHRFHTHKTTIFYHYSYSIARPSISFRTTFDTDHPIVRAAGLFAVYPKKIM